MMIISQIPTLFYSFFRYDFQHFPIFPMSLQIFYDIYFLKFGIITNVMKLSLQ